ncbi:heme-binding domain-containing protein [Adhaeribacter soli]|uniref:Cytochrome C n=1 Tax=Adhaeribacter soli TaxID=2607655 RepID=A0A5N1J4X5_9BACT|nr:heme-binding domain-containing protein [Adhaeribacter soli]KAA9340129.1 cytochrome C [Adhaeribacter soli]
MTWTKKILLGLVILFIAIQFIQPARNENGQVLPSEITKVYAIPDNVQTIFRNSCYDCHSNNTHYPWYAKIQPGGWWLASHIREGKDELNFSTFGDYSTRRQKSKLKSIVNSIQDDEMPLKSYLLLHPKAKLSDEEKLALINWSEKIQEDLENKN